MLILLSSTTPDTTAAKWALAGVVIGAVIGGLVQILSSWLQWKREEKHALRARRADNLYLLQDQIQLILETTRKIISQLDDPMTAGVAVFLWDDTELKNQITRLESLSIRVGDDPLSNQIDKALSKLYYSAQYNKGVKERRQLFNDARSDLKGVQLRVGVLLHTDTDTDIGMGAKPAWFKRRRRREYEASIRSPPTQSAERVELDKAKNAYNAERSKQPGRSRSLISRIVSWLRRSA